MSSDIGVEKYVNRGQKMTRYLDLVNKHGEKRGTAFAKSQHQK